VSEVAVIGIPDEKRGERPLALIVLQKDNAVTEQHNRAHVREWAERGVISKWAVPEVRFADLLEKTSVGKLDKKVLRQKQG
jgi:acyl-CoA synthetase (AMP-forming)/AMP-acid ligase II